ncbi:protein FAR1-RELATED SEQUENCE 5-like [Pistacia vera]|uniref:protein FAR1-RELATED SEQUENCE 5-like n=1 Tax=Pistacia vera TaxID=55513 RepID=UPI001262CABF|nr:protein FAR1-RELATED SEQUENCE 5-like [Pistacia vera]
MEDNRSLEEECKPEPGMFYESFDKFFQYYKSYENKMGFEVAIRSSRKGVDGELIYANVACSCGGKRDSNSRNVCKIVPLTQSGCKARCTASRRSDGKWKIVSIIYEHNHELSSSSKSRFFKSNRIIQPYVKRKLEVNDRVGIRPNKNFNSLLVEDGGAENLTFLQKDCRNYIEKVRRTRLGAGDATTIQKYFLNMQKDNPTFFYIMDLDEDGRLQNVLWVDARSRAAFREFSDFVTFDTTCLTNKYDMSFAAFVCVDHHGHSTLLGYGLVSHEDTQTFETDSNIQYVVKEDVLVGKSYRHVPFVVCFGERVSETRSSQESKESIEAGAYASNVHPREAGVLVLSQGYSELSVTYRPSLADTNY